MEVKLHYFRAHGSTMAVAVKILSSISEWIWQFKAFWAILDFLLPPPWYYHGHGSSVILFPSPWYYRGSTSRWFGGIILYVNWKRFLSFADHIDRSHSHQIFQCDTIRIYSILFWIMHMTKSFPQQTSFIQKKKYRDKKIFCVSAASGKVCQTLFSIHIRQKKSR